MIKKLKKTCWIASCDYCESELFGYDYEPHFETKQGAIDMIEEDNIATFKGKHFCSTDCQNLWISEQEEEDFIKLQMSKERGRKLK